MIKAMSETAYPHRQRAELDDQIVQLALRHVGADDVPAGPVGLRIVAEDLTAPAGDQTLYPSGKRIRDRDLDQVDRLEQQRVTFRQGLLNRLASGGVESLVRAVDGVKLPGDQIDRDVDDREAERAAAERFDHPFLYCRDVIARDRPADHAVGERKAGTARQRLDLDRDVGELPMPAALPLEAGMLLGAVPDRFLVRRRRWPAVNREVVAVVQPQDADLQMDIA